MLSRSFVLEKVIDFKVQWLGTNGSIYWLNILYLCGPMWLSEFKALSMTEPLCLFFFLDSKFTENGEETDLSAASQNQCSVIVFLASGIRLVESGSQASRQITLLSSGFVFTCYLEKETQIQSKSITSLRAI